MILDYNSHCGVSIKNTTPTAAIQRGIDGGKVNVKRIEVTKYPSLISWPRLEANHSSASIPARNTTIYNGIKYAKP